MPDAASSTTRAETQLDIERDIIFHRGGGKALEDHVQYQQWLAGGGTLLVGSIAGNASLSRSSNSTVGATGE